MVRAPDELVIAPTSFVETEPRLGSLEPTTLGLLELLPHRSWVGDKREQPEQILPLRLGVLVLEQRPRLDEIAPAKVGLCSSNVRPSIRTVTASEREGLRAARDADRVSRAVQRGRMPSGAKTSTTRPSRS